jgi:NAD+ kinase
LFRSVGIVARYDRKQALQLAEQLAEFLRKRGLEVLLEDTLAGKIGSKEDFVPLQDMRTDLIITIGGDGTILRTCVAIPKPEPPLLAINMGVRGFLTEVEPKGALEALEKCLKGEYKIEKCDKLAVSTLGKTIPDALNDVVVTTGEPSKILYTKILKDGEPILKCEADGLITSTQTGSTGYSLSAGGPVLDPGIGAFVLTPICSLTVFHSIVFPADSTVTIEVTRPKKMLILVDGNYRQLVEAHTPTVTITKSKNMTSFIRYQDDFYHRLRSRLLFKGTG